MSGAFKAKLELTTVVDIEKRKFPSRHYVYVIQVQWSNGEEAKIARKFSSFFNTHMKLLEKFPIEGGQKDPNKRIIPFLPGKNLFARNHSREVTLKRLQNITEYCEALTSLPDNISQSDILQKFFQPTSDDEERYGREKASSNAKGSNKISLITGPLEFERYIAIADFDSENKTQVNLRSGEVVEVAEKNENGWWLVSNTYGANGWVPGAYLEKIDGEKENLVTEVAEKGQGECYRALHGYEATSSDELSFPGETDIEVLQKNLEGWWYACYDGKEGFVPASYLTKKEKKCDRNESDLAEEKQAFVRAPPKRSTIRRKLPLDVANEQYQKEDTGRYIATFDFDGNVSDGVKFTSGQILEVLEQSDNGWWFVNVEGKHGWGPASFLKPVATAGLKVSPKKEQIISTNILLGASNSSLNSPVDPPTQTFTLSSSKLSSIQEAQSFPISWNINDIKAKVSDPARLKPSPPLKPNKPHHSTHNSPQKKIHLHQQTPLSPRDLEKTSKEEFNTSSSWSLQASSVSHVKAAKQLGNDLLRSPDKLEKSINRNLSTGIEKKDWYFEVGREEAERSLLHEGEEGFFIVRPSSKKNPDFPYSLTLLHNGAIFNFHIRKRKDGMFATGIFTEGEKRFESVADIIEFYKSHTLVVGDATNRVKLSGSPKELH